MFFGRIGVAFIGSLSQGLIKARRGFWGSINTAIFPRRAAV